MAKRENQWTSHPMDTSDLSDKTYDAIMIAAERFNHDLTLRFGVLSYNCEDESDFIRKSKELIHRMLQYDEWEVHEMFFGNPPRREDFHIALNKILHNIAELQ